MKRSKTPERRLGREILISVCEEHGQSQCDRCRHYSEDDGVVIHTTRRGLGHVGRLIRKHRSKW